MFGSKLDYYLLKPLAHGRNRATEEELDALALASSYTMEDAKAHLQKVQDVYFDGRIPIQPDLRYLDLGCGMGRLSMGLALQGARNVTGIDIVPRHVEEARKVSEVIEPGLRPRFEHIDVHDWRPDELFDVIFVMGAMEHIHDPSTFLKMLPRLLKPGGLAFVSHEPFQSPIGDHMREFFRVQIPWRGLLFSEDAILRLRKEYFRPTDDAKRYDEIAGGLNQMSFSQYLEWADEAGLEFVYHSFNPQVRHHPRFRVFQPFNSFLTRVPKLQDYFIICAYSIMKRKA